MIIPMSCVEVRLTYSFLKSILIEGHEASADSYKVENCRLDHNPLVHIKIGQICKNNLNHMETIKIRELTPKRVHPPCQCSRIEGPFQLVKLLFQISNRETYSKLDCKWVIGL